MVRKPAVWIGVVAAIGVTLLLAFDVPGAVELPLRDFLIRTMPRRPATATAVVAIDEASLRRLEPWPWPRPMLAQLVDRAAEAGAKGLVIDVLLADPRPGDEILAASMRRLPSVAVAVLAERGQWLVPAPELEKAAIVAHGNFELDHDGILRRFATTKQDGASARTALSLEAAAMARADSVPVGQSVAPAFRTPPQSIPLVSAADLLAGRADPALLRDRILFLGPTALGLGDRVLTPVSARLAPDPGVAVHAAATESLLRGERIREIPPLFAGLIAGGIAAVLVALRRSSRRSRLASSASLIIAIAAAAWVLLATSGLALPVATLLLSALVTSIAVEAQVMAASTEDLGIRLEEIATRMAEQRAHDVESKRVLAHELKTPLASMRNLSQLLADFDLSDAERRRVASLLESEAGKLQSMVTVLLDLERLPLRDFRASTAVTDLGTLVNDRITLLRAGTSRQLTAIAPAGIFVRADAMLLERVVDNLVGNAVKYTDEPVRISVRGNGSEAVVEVADRGPGIPPADRERIFQRFYRGATAAGTEGLGLGLSLVSEVVRWHGGTVSMDTAPEGGSLFRFTLPAETNS